MSAEIDVDSRVRRWDMLGMFVSALCVVHCVAMPLVLGLLPALGLGFLAKSGFHQVLALIVLGVALGAFVPGYRTHRRASVPALGGAGVALLGFAAFAPQLTLFIESGLTALGGTLLVTAHVLNRRALGHFHDHGHAHAERPQGAASSARR